MFILVFNIGQWTP